MFKKIVPIVESEHKNLRVRPIDDFEFVQDTHLASVMCHEFSRVAPTYPIVFLEDKQNDQFKPVVMLGLKDGENLFVQDGKWNASYIPAIIRRYPFALVKAQEENRYIICIDEESKFVNKKEGEVLFNKDGSASEVINKVKQYLTELQQMEMFTNQFCQYMKSENMFTPLNMKVKIGNEVKTIAGAYVINEERLNQLNEVKFMELRTKSYLPLIYSHLSSLAQIERLITLSNKEKEVIEKIEHRFEEK